MRLRPVQGGIPESHSWMTDRAKEMSQKVGSWSPEGLSEEGLGRMTNSQVDSSETHTQDTPFLVVCKFICVRFTVALFLFSELLKDSGGQLYCEGHICSQVYIFISTACSDLLVHKHRMNEQ